LQLIFLSLPHILRGNWMVQKMEKPKEGCLCRPQRRIKAAPAPFAAVLTTMIYTHTVQSVIRKESRSPLDF